MNHQFLQLTALRRSIYNLGKNLPVTNEQLVTTIKNAVKNAPSAFNSQSSRVVILLGKESEHLWDITAEQLKKITSAETFAKTKEKIQLFSSAAGVVLFFEDQTVVKQLQEQFPTYSENFPIWSEHSTAIAQYAVWLALAEQRIGANLQHYNPLIDEAVQKTWAIPNSWKLRAQLNFGSIVSPAAEKTYIPDEDRFKIFGL